VPAYANGKNCFVAGVNPKKAGEDFEGIPIYASVKEAAQHRRHRQRDLRAARGRGRRHLGSGGSRPGPGHLHHRRHPIKDMLEVRNKMKAKEAAGGKKTLLLGPNCPGTDHARRDQDRHHARPHPPQGPHRRGQPQRHADL
jgi:succinyl-CoA synthetase alpha subunit